MYDLTCSMPFSGFYRRMGIRGFQLWIGFSAIGFALLVFVVLTVHSISVL